MRKRNVKTIIFIFCFMATTLFHSSQVEATVCKRHTQVSELFSSGQISFNYELNNSDIGRVDFFVHLTSSAGTLSPSFQMVLDNPTDSQSPWTKSLIVVSGGVPDSFPNGDGVQLFHLGGNSYQISLHLKSYYDMLGMCGPISTDIQRKATINITNLNGSGHLQVNAVSKKCQPSDNAAIPAEAVVTTNPAVAFSEVTGSCPEKDTDVIFVLDRSGSMTLEAESGSATKRYEVLNQTVNTIYNIWQQNNQFNYNDQTAVVNLKTTPGFYTTPSGKTFASFNTIPPNQTVPPAVFNNDLIALIDHVHTYVQQTGPNTPMGKAMNIALTGFQQNDHYRHIVLFTDGEQNGAPNIEINLSDPQAATTFQGVQLRSYGIPVHTLGTGFGQNTEHGLGLRRIAIDTGGRNEFFTSPVMDSTNAFLSTFVQMFQANTLGIVEFRNGDISKGQGAKEEKHFQVNRSAKRAIFLLGWHPEDPRDLNPNALTMEVIPPGASNPITAGYVTDNQHSHIRNIILPLPGGTPHEGEWTIRIKEKMNGSNQKYHVSVLVDETKVEYSLGVTQADLGTGDPIIIQAVVTQDGEPVKNLSSVTAKISRPATALGAFLKRHELSLTDIKTNPPGAPADALTSDFDRKLYRLLTDPKNAELLKPVNDSVPVILYDDGSKESGDATRGDGIYTGKYERTKVPGTYEVIVTAKGSTAAIGQFSRSEKSTALVRVIYADPTNSEISAYRTKPNKYTITIVPADRHKNVLGPGFAQQIKVTVASGQGITSSPITDERENGTYTTTLSGVPEGADPVIIVSVSGKELKQCKLSECSKSKKRYAVFGSAGENFQIDSLSRKTHNPGGSYQIGFEYSFTNQWSFEGLLGFDRFRRSSSNKLDIYRFSADAKYYPIIGTYQLGLVAGIGAYNLDPGPTKIGMNAGVSGEYRITTEWSLEILGNYHTVFTSGDNIQYSTVHGGVRYRF